MEKLVTVMLARIPTLADYNVVGLSGGSDTDRIEFGNDLINVLMPQLNNDYVVVMRSVEHPTGPESHTIETVIFETDAIGMEGSWYLPADLFTIKHQP